VNQSRQAGRGPTNAGAVGTYPQFARALAKTHLLILDDWGISAVLVVGSREILDLLDDRVEHGSLIISPQLPVVAWYESLGERTVADAINGAIPVELTEESMRKIQSKRKKANGPMTLGPELEERVVQT